MSRLAERLKELLNTRGLTQAEVVRRSDGIGKYVSKGTVSTYLSNPPLKPKRQVIEAFAEILDVPVSDLEEAAAFTGREPFRPDPSSDRLTAPQRAAVNEVIRQLAEANAKAGDGNVDRDPTSMNDVARDDAGEVAEFRPRQLPAHLHAAYDTGDETMKQRLDRESEERDSGSQDLDDYS